jgi:ADP-ribose pyrophosphatase
MENETVVFEGKTFEVVRRKCKSGAVEGIIEIARRSPGVRIIITRDGKMLLTKEFRVEYNGYDYRLPGGKIFDNLHDYRQSVKNKEDMLSLAERAAKRECLEETGVEAESLEFFQIARAGTNVEWDLFYFTTDKFAKGSQKLEDSEVIQPEWKTFDDVKKMCLNGDIKEDRTVGVLLKFLLKNQ